MVVTWLMGGIIVGLVLLYMTSPYYEQWTVSAARFFEDTPARSDSTRLNFSSLLLSRPFYLQLATLLCLLAGLLLVQCQREAAVNAEGVGVLVAVDSSASMSTVQGGVPRTTLAQAELALVLQHLDSLEVPTCFQWATFDLEVTLLSIDDAPELSHSEKGTDLNLIRALATQANKSDTTCQITHLVVVTDIPAPDWIAELNKPMTVIWRDVGLPVENIGITAVEGGGGSIFGGTSAVDITVESYVASSAAAQLIVRNALGDEVHAESLNWSQPGTRPASFTPDASGEYTIELTPNDSYLFDNQTTIMIDLQQQLRVDWQLADTTIPQLLGWQLNAADPHLRVLPVGSALDDVPTLLIGSAYGDGVASAEIDYFNEASPLLNDINLDVLETIPIQGVSREMIMPLQPVVYGLTDDVWLAVSRDPLTAYIPALPTGLVAPSKNLNTDRISTTLFFNALRYLLQTRQPAPLYTNTTASQPNAEGNRNVLHLGEGNTALAQRNSGDVNDIQPVSTQVVEQPVWPLLLAAAALLFTVERGLAAYGGLKWR